MITILFRPTNIYISVFIGESAVSFEIWSIIINVNMTKFQNANCTYLAPYLRVCSIFMFHSLQTYYIYYLKHICWYKWCLNMYSCFGMLSTHRNDRLIFQCSRRLHCRAIPNNQKLSNSTGYGPYNVII